MPIAMCAYFCTVKFNTQVDMSGTLLKKMLLVVFILIPFYAKSDGSYVVYDDPSKGVSLSDLYKVYINGDTSEEIVVFRNECNKYYKGMPGERKNDDKPLTKFKGRSIHWGHFAFDGKIEVLINFKRDISGEDVRIYPSRFNVDVKKVDNHTISFVLEKQGQYSVEVGEDGYREGLLLFADPIESDIPENLDGWIVIEHTDTGVISKLGDNDKALYFRKGVHNIGVFKVPKQVKEIYLEPGAWVYGSFIMDGKECSNVKIYGRGVLSGAKLHLRESHMIEAKNGADGITVDGIVISDYSFFAIRLLGCCNNVLWTKIVGGWIYNCDGIAAYANSKIKNCFIWANDDNIKIYRDNIIVEDVVCWQLDNGAIFQLNWSNSQARNCIVRNVDIIRAEWDSDRPNNGIISCRNAGGVDENFIFENVYTDTPVTHIFRLSPMGGEEQVINNFLFRNWNIKVDNLKGKSNYIEGTSEKNEIIGLFFDEFKVNGIKLNEDNFERILKISMKNCARIYCK